MNLLTFPIVLEKKFHRREIVHLSAFSPDEFSHLPQAAFIGDSLQRKVLHQHSMFQLWRCFSFLFQNAVVDEGLKGRVHNILGKKAVWVSLVQRTKWLCGVCTFLSVKTKDTDLINGLVCWFKKVKATLVFFTSKTSFYFKILLLVLYKPWNSVSFIPCDLLWPLTAADLCALVFLLCDQRRRRQFKGYRRFYWKLSKHTVTQI